jgi:hypothetical protein
VQLQIEIQPIAFKITSWRTMGEKKTKKAPKSYDVQVKQTYFLGKSRIAHPLPTSKFDPCVLS